VAHPLRPTASPLAIPPESSDKNNNKRGNTVNIKSIKPWMWVTGGAVVLAIILVVSIFSSLNGIQKDGVNYETQLNAQYLDNQNELGAYISGFYEQVGVANLKSQKMDQILTDAVKGRYDGNASSAQVGRGQLFSAIQEAYPNIDLSVYDKILNYVQAGRTAYKDKQSKLLDMLRNYDNWRKSGLIHSKLVSMMGFPSGALQAHISATVVTGAAAEAQMYVIVLPSDAAKAYQTGTLDPLDPTKTP
jgi:hypothetical protein